MAEICPLYTHYWINDLSRKEVFSRLSDIRQTISALRMEKEEQETSHLDAILEMEKKEQENISKIKEDMQKEFERRLEELKSEIREKDSEIGILKSENEALKNEVRTKRCLNDSGIVTGTSSPAEILSNLSPSSAIVPDYQRLQRRMKDLEEKGKREEHRADRLNILLNEKLIELNKLQLTLSSQTKDMIQLEKAYYNLRRHLLNGAKSPLRFSSKLTLATSTDTDAGFNHSSQA